MAICFDLKKVINESLAATNLLIGRRNETAVEVINCVAVVRLDNDGDIVWANELENLAEFLPYGNVLELVGVCGHWPIEKYKFPCAYAAAKSEKGTGKLLPISDTLLVGRVDDASGAIQFESYSSADGKSCPVDVDGMADTPCKSSLAASTTTFRLRTCAKFSFHWSPDEAATCKSLADELSAVKERCCGEQSAYFINSTLIQSEEGKVKTVGEVCSTAGQQTTSQCVVPIEHTVLMSSSGDNIVPVIGTQSCAGERVHLSCPLDAMLLVRDSTPTPEMHSLCTRALGTQITALHARMEAAYRDSQGLSLSTYRPYHFNIPHCGLHSITVYYASQQMTRSLHKVERIAEDALESMRKELHHRFNLPFNRPLLRRHMALGADVEQSPYLTNVHMGLNLSSAIGGTVSLVQGIYSYHHYMQDRFNDDGWGCAYRSLQTLWSWFKHQGYTSLPVPTHRDIQQTLVDVEDKQSSFVGSKQWIGSIEVQTVLNQQLEIDSRILFVMNGASMPSNAREIAMHFQQQGTPIMIGGGTLAHTIIGIDFNDRTGDVRFLILDPHYTGGENIGVIHNKGWCGWKTATFWNPQAHYNMCMPLRPSII